MGTMNIEIQRKPITLWIDGKQVDVEELGVLLAFSRKPADVSEVGGTDRMRVFVTETIDLTPKDYDQFARGLLVSQEWLRGKGGGVRGGYLCVEVIAPGRPHLYVNPEGGDYARYVARLG